MKAITFKSILAGTAFIAAVAFSPAYAQDSAPLDQRGVETETVLDIDLDEFTLENDMDPALTHSTIITPNEGVMGALESNEFLIDDSFSPEHDADIAGDYDTDLGINTDDEFIINDDSGVGSDMVLEPEVSSDEDFIIEPEIDVTASIHTP